MNAEGIQLGDARYLRPSNLASLWGLVHRITAYDSDTSEAAFDREVASFVVPIIISFADPFRIAFDRPPGSCDRIGSFVSGLHPGYVDIGFEGPVSCVQIDLTPIGARLFFGRPMSEFATRLVPLEDIEDRGLNELRDRLGAATSRSERVRIATAFMERRLVGRAIAPEAAFVWSAIQHSRGRLQINRLTEDLAWSRKRLAAHARDAFGLTPKLLARVARFEHASDLAGTARLVDWAGIAAECGYADQAHMVRDFTAFAGAPPERWRQSRTAVAAKQTFNTEGDGVS
jgi:AraC-like DNA-binding protein